MSKYIFYPFIIGITFFILYHFMPKMHMGLWLMLMYGMSIWLPICLYLVIKYPVKHFTIRSEPLFLFGAIVIYFFALIFLSKSFDFIVYERRLFGLGIITVLYLLLMHIFTALPIRMYDYGFGFTYSVIISFFFLSNSDFIRLDFFISLWLVGIFSQIIICKYRSLKSM